MLALTIFLFTLLSSLISWIGQEVVLTSAHALYLRVTASPLQKQQTSLKSDILQTKADMLATSPQGRFAKWAKLRRKLDKQIAELDTLNKQITMSRTTFSMSFKAFLFGLTTITPFLITSWYGKQAVFWLPPGWFGPLTWWLSFPFAPYGSVSCGVWSMVCKRVVGLAEKNVRGVLACWEREEVEKGGEEGVERKEEPEKQKSD
ncbi:hypothetical protein BT69DRAFT_1276779 [Atractiella rhizophila]|nr:hypothetical protein BT69DRAFT_1276779 [Atractiella rhizophila]